MRLKTWFYYLHIISLTGKTYAEIECSFEIMGLEILKWMLSTKIECLGFEHGYKAKSNSSPLQ